MHFNKSFTYLKEEEEKEEEEEGDSQLCIGKYVNQEIGISILSHNTYAHGQLSYNEYIDCTLSLVKMRLRGEDWPLTLICCAKENKVADTLCLSAT